MAVCSLLPALILTGCRSTAPDPYAPHDVLARLQDGEALSQITAPDTVSAGTAFEVQFTTFAGGCTRTVARVDVSTSGSVSAIHGYDHGSGGVVCTQDIFMLPHTATVQFEERGTATIQVIGTGAAVPGGDPQSSLVVLSKTVVVL